jgi:hypothetical protein
VFRTRLEPSISGMQILFCIETSLEEPSRLFFVLEAPVLLPRGPLPLAIHQKVIHSSCHSALLRVRHFTITLPFDPYNMKQCVLKLVVITPCWVIWHNSEGNELGTPLIK